MTCTGFSAGGKCRKSRPTPPERPHVRNSQKQSGTAAKIFAAVPLFSLRRSAETKRPALRRAVSGLRTGKGVCASPQAAPSAAERRFGRTDAKTPASMLSGAGSPRGGPRTAPAEPKGMQPASSGGCSVQNLSTYLDFFAAKQIDKRKPFHYNKNGKICRKQTNV